MSFEELREVSHKEEFCVWNKHVFAQILKNDFKKSELKAAKWIRKESESNVCPSTYHINVLIACYIALKKKESKGNAECFCSGATLGGVGVATAVNDISVEDVASELSSGMETLSSGMETLSSDMETLSSGMETLSSGMETLGSIAEMGGSFGEFVSLASSIVPKGGALSLAMTGVGGILGAGKGLSKTHSCDKTIKQLTKALDGPGLKRTLEKLQQIDPMLKNYDSSLDTGIQLLALAWYGPECLEHISDMIKSNRFKEYLRIVPYFKNLGEDVSAWASY